MSSVNNRTRAKAIIEQSDEPLSLIAQLSVTPSENDRVCWHFGPGEADESCEEDAFGEQYYDTVAREAAERFPETHLAPMAFGSFEVWESSLPNKEWIKLRVTELAEFAESVGAGLEGWSYEPKDRTARGIPQAFAPDAVAEED